MVLLMATRKKKIPARGIKFFPYVYFGILAVMFALAGAVLVSR